MEDSPHVIRYVHSSCLAMCQAANWCDERNVGMAYSLGNPNDLADEYRKKPSHRP